MPPLGASLSADSLVVIRSEADLVANVEGPGPHAQQGGERCGGDIPQHAVSNAELGRRRPHIPELMVVHIELEENGRTKSSDTGTGMECQVEF